MWNSASNDGQLVKHRHFTNYFGPDAPFQVVDLNSNPHAIPLFQSCDDPPRKVLAFVLASKRCLMFRSEKSSSLKSEEY